MNTNRNSKPMIKDMTDAGLVENYIGLKALAYNGAQVRSRNLGKVLRELDITIAIARKRGVQLPV